MAFDVERLIATAEAEEGYIEKASGDLKYLYDKKANPGTANYTKYGFEMSKIYPAAMDYPAAWCDAFVDWCFMKAYGVENARALIHGNFDDYTVASAQLYKNKHAWFAVPKRGDQVFFQNSSRICHTGIVLYTWNDTLYTIEGNTSSGSSVVANGGAVCKKSYPLNYSRIAGYGRPAYGKEIAVTPGWRRAKDGVRWWYEYADRTWPADGWYALESASGKHWYLFDKEGYMLTGRQEDNKGDTYFLEDRIGPDEGAMFSGDAGGKHWICTL